MAKRRSRKYTWFPVIEQQSQPEGQEQYDNTAGIQFDLVVNQGTDIHILPVTFDSPSEPSDFAASDHGVLAGMLGQEYFLRRLVGKVFAEYKGEQVANLIPAQPHAALFGAGFFVARASDSEVAGVGGADSPIGVSTSQEVIENYSPLSGSTIREPWIWRRTWILSNKGQRDIQSAQSSTGDRNFAIGTGFPDTTAGYGSVMDGPHLDAKTGRLVRSDERLWFVVAARHWPLNDLDTNFASGEINGFLDLRILGALRRARNRGVF